MPIDLVALAGELAWPLAIALAWVVGELGHRWTHLPRISLYGIVGFALGSTQLGLLPPVAADPISMLANVAFGLILFEFGYRINLRWLRANPWIGLTGLLEAGLSFAAVYALAQLWEMPVLTSLLLASLAMSTSPAALMRVINEERSSGQVTERVLHLTAVNCLLSVFAFKAIVGFWTFQTSGSVLQAASNSVVLLAVSAGIGGAFGFAVPALLRRFGRLTRDATVGFAIGVILLVAITHALKVSPVLASLTFGVVAHHRRVVLNQTQRNFGALGDLLAIVLFVFVATTIAWQRAWAGLGLALLVILVRALVKVGVVGSLARVSGITWRKGVLTGLAMTPISVFVILLLEQARFLGIDLVDQLAPLAAATLLLELIGPVVTQRALLLARESGEPPEG
ncbi:MAG: cation:proton antiporter [Piscinibacter sp.]|nr:cation:proton antiporter [Piscinibacter sp.]